MKSTLFDGLVCLILGVALVAGTISLAPLVVAADQLPVDGDGSGQCNPRKCMKVSCKPTLVTGGATKCGGSSPKSACDKTSADCKDCDRCKEASQTTPPICECYDTD